MPAFSSQESRYKIYVMTAHGQNNWPWYCYIDQNNRQYEDMKKDMISRLKNYLKSGKKPCTVQALMVYEKEVFVEKLSLSELI